MGFHANASNSFVLAACNSDNSTTDKDKEKIKVVPQRLVKQQK